MIRRVAEKIHDDPPTWKDWLHASTAAVTLAAVLVQGGRMIERMDAITKALDADAATIRTLGGDMARLQLEVETGNGKDALHEERLRSLQQQLDEMRARVRGLR